MTQINKIISDWFYQYSDDVYHFLVYYTGTTDVDDLVQEVFIRAGRGYKNFNHDASPKTWLIRIARNIAIDESRKKETKMSQRAHEYDEKIFNQEQKKPMNTPEEQLLHQEEMQELYHSINHLKDNYRDVVILRAIKGFSIHETAEALNWTEAKVRVTYHRALNKLSGQDEGRDIHA